MKIPKQYQKRFEFARSEIEKLSKIQDSLYYAVLHQVGMEEHDDAATGYHIMDFLFNHGTTLEFFEPENVKIEGPKPKKKKYQRRR